MLNHSSRLCGGRYAIARFMRTTICKFIPQSHSVSPMLGCYGRILTPCSTQTYLEGETTAVMDHSLTGNLLSDMVTMLPPGHTSVLALSQCCLSGLCLPACQYIVACNFHSTGIHGLNILVVHSAPPRYLSHDDVVSGMHRSTRPAFLAKAFPRSYWCKRQSRTQHQPEH